MNRKIAKKNLLDVKKILDKYKISFWLHTGTLLGAIREKDFIKTAHDIDLRIKAKEWNHHAFKHLQSLMKCRLVRPIYAHDSKLVKYIQLSCGNECPINIAFAYHYTPDNIYVTWMNKLDNILGLTPAEFYHQEAFINFLGTKFRVPHNPIAFLERIYGKKWRIPIKEREKGWVKRRPIDVKPYLKWFLKNRKEAPEIG